MGGTRPGSWQSSRPTNSIPRKPPSSVNSRPVFPLGGEFGGAGDDRHAGRRLRDDLLRRVPRRDRLTHIGARRRGRFEEKSELESPGLRQIRHAIFPLVEIFIGARARCRARKRDHNLLLVAIFHHARCSSIHSITCRSRLCLQRVRDQSVRANSRMFVYPDTSRSVCPGRRRDPGIARFRRADDPARLTDSDDHQRVTIFQRRGILPLSAADERRAATAAAVR